MKSATIVIVGGGPAGAAVAIGLARLGYQHICLISEPRPFAALEGVSASVVKALHSSGFKQALQCLPTPSPRRVCWNNQLNKANTEQLIDRQQFDAGLQLDLCSYGIECINARVTAIDSSAQGHTLSYATECGEQHRAFDFLVEARGRAAPGAGLPRLRGAETVSLLQYRQGPAMAPCSAVQSFSGGWAWMAADDKGRRYLQLSFCVASAKLPAKALLAQHCNQILAKLSLAQPFVDNAHASGQIHARTSTPILCQQPCGDNWIRVGDAAMSVDPLSGNGIYQTLSSALQAPAVINTLLQRPENSALAKQFHRERIKELFYRFARIGRDFYQMEQQWPELPFWASRSNWPDQQPLHQQVHISQMELACRPVIKQGLIESAQVVVNPDQPLGIWHLAGIELAGVLRAYHEADCWHSFSQQMQLLQLNPVQIEQMQQWLQHHGARLPDAG